MNFITTVGAIAVGFIGAVVLLTVVLFAWIWANEKVQKPEFEPILPLSLLVATSAFFWFMQMVAGDVGVFGVICGAASWGFYLFKSYNSRNRSTWRRLRDWFASKVR